MNKRVHITEEENIKRANAAAAGYTYGTAAVAQSPVSLAELRDLERAVGFGPDDVRSLKELWDAVAEHREELFGVWMSRVADFFLPTFAGADGTPDESYLEGAHTRFMQWIADTCLRPHDEDWLDYQHEIGLRHHRAKKNRTDGVSAVDHVPLRYLVVAVHPLTSTVLPFLEGLGVERPRAERLAAAWSKSLVLQIALWTRAYASDCW